jgi:mannose-6-phosphate isomerase-like protein (cupin superfamily)
MTTLSMPLAKHGKTSSTSPRQSHQSDRANGPISVNPHSRWYKSSPQRRISIGRWQMIRPPRRLVVDWRSSASSTLRDAGGWLHGQFGGWRMIRSSGSLGRAPLLVSLSAEEVRATDSRCQWRRVNAGEWVIDYQSEGTDVFFVMSGHARVVIGTSGREIILHDIYDGEYFGELSALDGRPRSAGILAITDTVVARMSSSIFRELIHGHPDVCDSRRSSLKSAHSIIARLNRRTSTCASAFARNCFDCRERPRMAASSFLRPRRTQSSPHASARIVRP